MACQVRAPRGSAHGAAEEGHLDVLKFLHEMGCPWHELATEAAARGGHLDVLKFLHEKGCPWNQRATEAAARGGHMDVLKFLLEKGYHVPRCEDVSMPSTMM